ncbi:MAG: hypothetical protein ACRD2B_08470 [Terriglobia bacterium]
MGGRSRLAASFALYPLLFLLLWAEARGQGIPVPTVRLALQRSALIPEAHNGAMELPLKCDRQGNVYVQQYWGGKPGAAPIVKISRNGKGVTRFALESDHGYQKGDWAHGFAVGPSGELYWLAGPESGHPEILIFRSDGGYDRSIELDTPAGADPFSIAVVSSEEFLISGVVEHPHGGAPDTPFAALFDEAGNLVRSIAGMAGGQTESGATKARGPQVEDSANLREVSAAPDGNIYLFQPGSKAGTLWVISSNGDLLRRVRLTPPVKGAAPLTMTAGAGRVIIDFEQTDKAGNVLRDIYSLYDPLTGDRLLDYEAATASNLGVLACYTNDEHFVFLKGDSLGRLEIQTAAPE